MYTDKLKPIKIEQFLYSGLQTFIISVLSILPLNGSVGVGSDSNDSFPLSLTLPSLFRGSSRQGTLPASRAFFRTLCVWNCCVFKLSNSVILSCNPQSVRCELDPTQRFVFRLPSLWKRSSRHGTLPARSLARRGESKGLGLKLKIIEFYHLKMKQFQTQSVRNKIMSNLKCQNALLSCKPPK